MEEKIGLYITRTPDRALRAGMYGFNPSLGIQTAPLILVPPYRLRFRCTCLQASDLAGWAGFGFFGWKTLKSGFATSGT